MVVTRRTPVVPQPPSSRGSQPPARTLHAKDSVGVSRNAASGAATTSHAASSDGDKQHHNGLDDNPAQTTKKSRRRNKKKYQKSNFQAFLDFLTKILLLAFTIYAFSVCPQDVHQQSPICRGLTEYKRVVLDPFFIPPIQSLLVHPSISPHVERTKPYVHRAIEIATPIILRARQEWNLRIVPQWENRVVPEWNKRVVPQWKKHIVPRLNRHLTPRIQHIRSVVEPYRLYVMREYDQRIVPGVQVALYNLQRWQRRAEPYVLLAAAKTKDGYDAAKPYVIPLAKKIGHGLQEFALFLRQQRQKFVDPHVAKIWEKVKELSSGQVVHETPPEHESPTALLGVLESLEHEHQTAVPSASNTPISRKTDVADMSPPLAAITLLDNAEPTSTKPTTTPEPGPTLLTQPPDVPTDPESLQNAESMFSKVLYESEPSPSATSIFVEEPSAETSSTWVATTTSRAPPAETESTQVPSLMTSSKIVIPVASATIPTANAGVDEEIDLDAFYIELGLDEPLFDGSEENGAFSGSPTETEDEKVQRLRLKADETARKRADIEGRQAKWEAELGAQIVHSTSQLQSRLANLRTAAAVELSSSAEVRNSIEGLVNEGERFIKGAEVYLRNIKGENRRSDEKQTAWDRVADRVSDKFNERLSATQRVVNVWYRTLLDKELEEVATVVAEVREVAEKGQLDLGLDYAWLDDVTYDDWQRYHGLITASEEYAHEAASIQNGTHSSVVVTNPMRAIFADLESEVQDVVIGFETRLRRIKRDGERAFNGQINGFAQKEEEKGTVVETEAEADPQVSVLPVPHDEGLVSPVVVGRSQAEVMEALDKVEPVEESGSNVETEEAVSRLVREMGGGVGIDHTEL